MASATQEQIEAVWARMNLFMHKNDMSNECRLANRIVQLELEINPAPTELEGGLCRILNQYSAEKDSDTPDFILATYMRKCLDAYNQAVKARDRWFAINPKPGEPKCWEESHGS